MGGQLIPCEAGIIESFRIDYNPLCLIVTTEALPDEIAVSLSFQ